MAEGETPSSGSRWGPFLRKPIRKRPVPGARWDGPVQCHSTPPACSGADWEDCWDDPNGPRDVETPPPLVSEGGQEGLERRVVGVDRHTVVAVVHKGLASGEIGLERGQADVGPDIGVLAAEGGDEVR